MKKVLAIVLCLVMVLGIFTAVPFSVSAEDTDETESSETIAENPDDKDLAESAEPDDLAEVGADLDVCESGAIDQSTWNSRINSLKSAYPNFSVWNGAPFNGGYSCEGWTRYVGYTVFGSHTTTWSISYSLDGVKAGDVIRYDYGSSQTDYGHSIFVTGVSGNTIYYVDCNGIGNYNQNTDPWTYVRSNGVYWDQSIQKNDAIIGMKGKTNFLYRRVSPGVGDHTHNYNTFAYYGSEHPHYAYYKCSCGDVKADTSKTSYSSTCSSCNHTVSYDANGGTGAPASQTKKYLSTLYLSDDEPTRPNHEFLGWSRDKNAKEPEYGPGARYTSDTSVTLYAVWEFLGYTIKFDADGATNVPYEKTVQDGENYTVSSVTPSKLGYIFMGWTLSKNSEVYYQSGDTISSYNLAASANSNYVVTLYAKWKAPTNIQANSEINYTLQPQGSIDSRRFYVLTPNETGCYYFNINGDIKSIWFYEDSNGSSIQDNAFLYLESGKPYYFSAVNYDDNVCNGAFSIDYSGIVKWNVEATVTQFLDRGYYYINLFSPTITLYDKNNIIVFKGNELDLQKEYNISLWGGNSFDSAGEHIITVRFNEEGNVTFPMQVTIIDVPITSIMVSIVDDKDYVIDCPDCEKNIIDNLDNVQLTINYSNGQIDNVLLKNCKRTYVTGFFTYYYKNFQISAKLESKSLSVGKNKVILSYRGLETSYYANVIESPVSKITLISAPPTIYDNEYFMFGETGNLMGFNFAQLFADQKLRLKVFYKDGSSKTVTIDKASQLYSNNDDNLALQLGDTQHIFTYSTHFTDISNPDADNYFSIDYLGKSLDIYLNIVRSENGYDKIVDYDVLTIPNFDISHYQLCPNLDGAKLKLKFESGKETIVTISEDDFIVGQAFGGEFLAEKNLYCYSLSLGFSPRDIVIKIMGISKTIAVKCSNTLSSVKVIGDTPNPRKLQNTLLELTYSDGKTIYAKTSPNEYNYGNPTDQGTWVYFSGEVKEGLYDYNNERMKVSFDNADLIKAKSIAYNIGKNCNISNQYNLENASTSDIDNLLVSLLYFTQTNSAPSDVNIPFAEASIYLNKYYGLSKNKIYSSNYYNDQIASVILHGNFRISFGYDESIQLYSETADSYIFKYSDENKTQYIEVSKELKLLSVSGTAPSAAKQYNISMKGGYSSLDSAFVGNTVTVCVNVPEGKEFVKWTSNNTSVKFANATSASTTFTMVGANVEITPVFKNSGSSANYILGDTDGDNVVSVLDATTIQKKLASIAVNSYNQTAADVDGDGVVSVIDATLIQKHLAHIAIPYEVGKTVS